ncbi:MAG: hypothetical protein OEM97_01045 [Acidimicrobiia bacterium]|nr:hypothetical protein [Acidimicrobiia bacterium]
MTAPITIDRAFQGPTGSGQGGYTAGLAAYGLTAPIRADFHKRIPLGSPLDLKDVDGHSRELCSGAELILKVAQTDTVIPTPPAVTVEAALAGRDAYPAVGHEMVPECFSCGMREGSFEVWAGPIGDGTHYATTWTPPDWTAPDGRVEAPYTWAAIDCPAGAKTTLDSDPPRVALTGSMTAEILAAVEPGTTYVIVAWADAWRGRRRTSGAALFDASGALLARQSSLWIALR